MKRTKALVLLALPGALVAQDALYYKFARGGGERVLNFATGVTAAPREARIRTGGSAPLQWAWGTGKHDRGLNAAPANPRNGGYQVDTGWDVVVPGDFTMAFFLRMKFALPTNDYGTLCGCVGNPNHAIRMYMEGVTTGAVRSCSPGRAAGSGPYGSPRTSNRSPRSVGCTSPSS